MNGVRFIALLSAVWVPQLGAGDYSKQVLADKPALYFRFDQVEGSVCLLYTSPSPRDQRGSGLAG